ncbi:hypothetical protein CCP2SC5_170009 [Azospirillaceae bacterium]
MKWFIKIDRIDTPFNNFWKNFDGHETIFMLRDISAAFVRPNDRNISNKLLVKSGRASRGVSIDIQQKKLKFIRDETRGGFLLFLTPYEQKEIRKEIDLNTERNKYIKDIENKISGNILERWRADVVPKLQSRGATEFHIEEIEYKFRKNFSVSLEVSEGLFLPIQEIKVDSVSVVMFRDREKNKVQQICFDSLKETTHRRTLRQQTPTPTPIPTLHHKVSHPTEILFQEPEEYYVREILSPSEVAFESIVWSSNNGPGYGEDTVTMSFYKVLLDHIEAPPEILQIISEKEITFEPGVF